MLRYKQIISIEGRVSEGQASYTRDNRFPRGQLGFNFAKNVKIGNAFRDPASSENKTQPLHRWVPWIAGFSAPFVQDCFETFLTGRRKKSVPRVLDPFAGVGTTIVQAALNGFDSIGFEINPYAALACKVKLNSSKLDLKTVETYLQKYRELATKNLRVATVRPVAFATRIPFFSPSVEEQALTFLEFAATIRQPDIADLFRVAFGAVMVSFSNYTYEPSLGSRPGAGKPLIEHANVGSILLGKLCDMVSDVQWMKDQARYRSGVGDGQISNMDFMESGDALEPSSIDLMVTSPPYMNNYHYVRNTRPQLFWLSLISAPNQLRSLEEANFGKYWQTVRDKEPIELAFKHAGLARTLAELRQTREEKGAYGGPGWANYVTTYFNDCYRFCRVLKRALVRGGVAVIVIGNSIIQGHEIKTDLVLADIARQHGLALLGVQQLRTKRVGASITMSTVRRGVQNRATLYETAVILRKK